MELSDLTTLSFEEAYAELEAILRRLDASDLSLDDSVALFERGRRLYERCQALLDAAELRVTQIVTGD